ncbi:RNA polymerase sigma factor [Streptomyces sp. NPDC059452]|uniref:RNA polymerase sigma factor n=1 Tax=Streptomyces sp. NPDC059452 TaxID=3346835 RepID=UPI00369E2B1E
MGEAGAESEAGAEAEEEEAEEEEAEEEEESSEEWGRFEAVYRASYPFVVRYLTRRLAAHLVDDAASEVFAIAWERWPTRRGAPLPWLYGIARRVAANSRRSQGTAARLVGRLQNEHPSSVSVDEPAAETQVLGRLGAAGVLVRIPDRDREVLMLVSWDGLEPHEAAQALGCSKAAFLVRLHRARRRLEREIANGGAPASAEGRQAVPRERTTT